MEADYKRAFPEGMKPVAVFDLTTPEGVEVMTDTISKTALEALHEQAKELATQRLETPIGRIMTGLSDYETARASLESEEFQKLLLAKLEAVGDQTKKEAE